MALYKDIFTKLSLSKFGLKIYLTKQIKYVYNTLEEYSSLRGFLSAVGDWVQNRKGARKGAIGSDQKKERKKKMKQNIKGRASFDSRDQFKFASRIARLAAVVDTVAADAVEVSLQDRDVDPLVSASADRLISHIRRVHGKELILPPLIPVGVPRCFCGHVR